MEGSHAFQSLGTLGNVEGVLQYSQTPSASILRARAPGFVPTTEVVATKQFRTDRPYVLGAFNSIPTSAWRRVHEPFRETGASSSASRPGR